MHEDLVGYTVEEARFLLLPAKTIRVIRKDGEPCICTQDVKPNRVNVEVENGKISKVVGVG
jgi:hypothetical protein